MKSYVHKHNLSSILLAATTSHQHILHEQISINLLSILHFWHLILIFVGCVLNTTVYRLFLFLKILFPSREWDNESH